MKSSNNPAPVSNVDRSHVVTVNSPSAAGTTKKNQTLSSPSVKESVEPIEA